MKLPLKNHDLSVYYSFFVNCKYQKPGNISDLLLGFDYVQKCFVVKLIELDNKNLCPPWYLMEAYMKYRHDIFSAVILKLLSIETSDMDTDCSFGKYGISSKRTPDYILDEGDLRYILEFSVGKNIDTLDFVKGSGKLKRLKYSDEVLELKNVGINFKLLIILCSLKDDCVDDIISQLESMSYPGFTGKRFSSEVLVKYINTCSIGLDIIYSFYSIVKKDKYCCSDLAVSRSLILLNEVSGNFARAEAEIYMVKSSNLIFIKKCKIDCLVKIDKIKDKIRKGENDKKGKFIIIFRSDGGKPRISLDSNGETLENLDIYLKEDVSSLYYYCYFDNSESIKPFLEIPGDISVRCTKHHNKKINMTSRKNDKKFGNLNSNFKVENIFSLIKNQDSDSMELYGWPSLLSMNDITTNAGENKFLFDTDYPDMLANNLNHVEILEKDKGIGCKMLANNMVDHISIFDSIKKLANKYELNNTFKEKDCFHPKNSFLFPIVTTAHKNLSETERCELIVGLRKTMKNNNYTKCILEKIINKKFCLTVRDDLNVELSIIRNKINEMSSQIHRGMVKDGGILKLKAYSLINDGNLEKVKLLNEEKMKYREVINKMSKDTSQRTVRLSYSKRSPIFSDFEAEMSHFGKKGRFGIGNNHGSDIFSDLEGFFKNLMNFLKQKSVLGKIENPLINGGNGPGPISLTKIKEDIISHWSPFTEDFRESNLGHACEFVSRLCYTLFKGSTTTINKNYIKYDPLGYNNAFVIIKGGPKIHRNQVSRLFRLFYPLSETSSEFIFNESFEKVKISGKHYILTPWTQWHQDILYSGMSMTERCYNLLSSYSVRKNKRLIDIGCHLMMPVLLGFHNRRKTEILMHNCRYLIVNIMGDFANIGGIIETFGTFNYTFFEMYLKESLIRNYMDFFKNMVICVKSDTKNIDSKLKENNLLDPFTKSHLEDSDDLTYIIYSTYLMTKSAIKKNVEQANNILPILEDIQDFDSNFTDNSCLPTNKMCFKTEQNGVDQYKTSFSYDPTFCQYLGSFCCDYLKTKAGNSKIRDIWEGCMDKEFDTIANSNGLRGWKNDNFFNKKGYEIVYTKLIELFQLSKHYESLEGLSLSDLTEEVVKEKYKLSDFCSRYNPDEVLFHVVDKIQRGGGREIFVMDITTKAHQNPLESFFGKISKFVTNEIISIPSNRRLPLIHKKFFEQNIGGWSELQTNWIMDCRRWAPHSILQKYVHFIYGMSPILPRSLVTHFLNFFYLMIYDKKFITRNYVFDTFKNNKSYEDHIKLFKDRPDLAKDAKELHVRFSFVMGIFNYLSSLMHSMNQLFASETIMKYCLKNDLGLCIISADAHSDDSEAKGFHERKESYSVSVALYDYLLKSANHMLSVKKSMINTGVYLEFLSILYMGNKLLPLSVKFLGSMPFQPTDKGYSVDLSNTFSQAIELMSYGASMGESYIFMRTMIRFIMRFYKLETNYSLPYNFLGTPDPHPIELLLSGSDSEIVKHVIYNGNLTNFLYTLLKEMLVLDETDPSCISLKWDLGGRLNRTILNDHLNFPNKELDNTWTVKNNKLGNCKLNYIWYYNKLQDPSFYSSIINEPGSRRVARIYSARNRSIRGSLGSLTEAFEIQSKLIFYCENIGQLPADKGSPAGLDIYLKMNPDLISLYNYLDNVDYRGKIEIRQSSNKPIFFQSTFPRLGDLSKINPGYYVTYKKEQSLYGYLGERKDKIRKYDRLDKLLEVLDLDPDNYTSEILFKIVSKILGKDDKTYNLIQSVPRELRRITNLTDKIDMINLCSIPGFDLGLKTDLASTFEKSLDYKSQKVPKDVNDFMSVVWCSRICNQFGVANYNIYKKENIRETVIGFKEKIPLEWKMILGPEYSENKVILKNVPYWRYWNKIQDKIGKSWYGEGSLIVSVGGPFLEVLLSDEDLVLVNIFTENCGFFSDTSSWYIDKVLSIDIELKQFLSNSNLGMYDKNYLGYSNSTKRWGFGSPGLFDYIIESSQEYCFLIPQWLSSELSISQKGMDGILETPDGFKKISFCNTGNFSILSGFKLLLDRDKVNNYKGDENLKKVLASSSSKYMKKSANNPVFILNNYGFNEIYHSLKNFSRRSETSSSEYDPDFMIQAFEEYKSSNEGFCYLTSKEMMNIHLSPFTPPLPYRVLMQVRKLGTIGLSPQESRMLKAVLVKSVKTGDFLEVYESLRFLMGEFEATNTLVLGGLKDKRIITKCKLLGYRTISPNILSKLVEISYNCVLNGQCTSYNLSEISCRLGLTRGEAFLKIVARASMECFTSSSVLYKGISIVEEVVKIFSEMYSQGLKEYIILVQDDFEVFRTIDIEGTEDDEFTTFVADLFEEIISFCGKFHAGDWPTLLNDIAREEIKGIMLPNRSFSLTKPNIIKTICLKLKGKKKKITLIGENKPYPGIICGEFFPLDSNGVEECDYCLQLCDFEDFSDEMTFDYEEKAPVRGMVVQNITNWRQFVIYRGIAETMYFSSCSIPEDLIKIEEQPWRVFKRSNKVFDVNYDLLINHHYIIVIGIETENIDYIENYIIMSNDEVLTYLERRWVISNEFIDEEGNFLKKDSVCDQNINYITVNQETVDPDNYFNEKEVVTETEAKIINFLSNGENFGNYETEVEDENCEKRREVRRDTKKIWEEVNSSLLDKKATVVDISKAKDKSSLTIRSMIENGITSGISMKGFEGCLKKTDVSREIKDILCSNKNFNNTGETASVFTDSSIYDSFDIIHDGLTEKILSGELYLTKEDRSGLFRYINLITKNVDNDHHRAFLQVIKSIVKCCRPSSSSDDKLYADINRSINKTIPLEKDDENEVNAFPELPKINFTVPLTDDFLDGIFGK